MSSTGVIVLDSNDYSRYHAMELKLPEHSKRSRLMGRQSVEFRLDATNVTNTPSFGFPTATVTSGTFGRIYNVLTSSARQVQLGVKYSF